MRKKRKNKKKSKNQLTNKCGKDTKHPFLFRQQKRTCKSEYVLQMVVFSKLECIPLIFFKIRMEKKEMEKKERRKEKKNRREKEKRGEKKEKNQERK